MSQKAWSVKWKGHSSLRDRPRARATYKKSHNRKRRRKVKELKLTYDALTEVLVDEADRPTRFIWGHV